MNLDVMLLTAAIADRRLCLRCASIRSDIVEHRLPEVIQRVRRRISVSENECDSCGRRRVVYQFR
jgi:hypothetical protein